MGSYPRAGLDAPDLDDCGRPAIGRAHHYHFGWFLVCDECWDRFADPEYRRYRFEGARLVMGSSMLEVTRPRTAWEAMLESLMVARDALVAYAMAYKEEGAWRDVENARAVIELLRSALERPDEPLPIRASPETWHRSVSAFRVGLEEMYGRPGGRAVQVAWNGLLDAVPPDYRDTHRVCDECTRLLPTAAFGRGIPGVAYTDVCLDCRARRGGPRPGGRRLEP